MANLIPDVTGSLRINTVGAMNDYQAAMKNMRDAVASPGDLINRLIESNERDKRAAEEKKRYETELGFKQRQEGRVVDELNRAQATREAVQAQLNPEMYRNARLGEVDTAIQQGLANLTPQERAVAEQEIAKNYNRNASGQFVLDRAKANEMVDPSAVLRARSDDLTLKLKDPNSKEYKDAQQAEIEADRKKAEYKHRLDIALNKARFDSERSLYVTKKEYDAKKEEEAVNAEAKLLTNNPHLKGSRYIDILNDPKATAIEKKRALEYAKSDLGNITKLKEEEYKDTKERDKQDKKTWAEEDNKVYSAMTYTANPKEILSYYEDFKKAGGSPQEFMRLIPNINWDKPSVSAEGVLFDWGLVDPNYDNIRKILDEGKKINSPTTGTGTNKAPSSDTLLNFIGEDSTFLFPQKGYATLYDKFGR